MAIHFGVGFVAGVLLLMCVVGVEGFRARGQHTRFLPPSIFTSLIYAIALSAIAWGFYSADQEFHQLWLTIGMWVSALLAFVYLAFFLYCVLWFWILGNKPESYLDEPKGR